MGQNSIRLFHLILFLCLSCTSAGYISAAGAATLYVGGTDPSHYPTIQAALDDAAAGDTVHVHAGTYQENIALKSGVRLEGEGADVTMIAGQSVSGTPSIAVMANGADSATLSGFSIGIKPAEAGSCAVYNNSSSSLLITRNVIRNAETGICSAGGSADIRNNVFYPGSGVYGINLVDTAAVIKNNIIMNYETGISVSGRARVTAGFNDLFLCAVNYDGVYAGTGAVSADPLFVDSLHYNFRLTETSPCVDAGDPADTVPPGGGPRIDIGAFEYQYPPEIVEGPQASIISDTEARIVWQTSTPSTGEVKYGMTADSFDQQAVDSHIDPIHTVTLTGLLPSTTYQYYVHSADEAGNAVDSETDYFTTEPAPDSDPPSLQVTVPDLITQPVEVHAAASDNTGISSVKFYVDDQLLYTFFGDAFDWVFDPSELSNGAHTLRVVTSDMAGAEIMQESHVQVAVKPADLSPPDAGIISPDAASVVSGGSVNVEAWGMDPDSGISRILFFIDDQLMHVAQINGEPGIEEHASWLWNSYGSGNEEDHQIKAVAVNNADLFQSAQHYVHVANSGSILDETGPFKKYLFIKLIRGQVKRDGIYYEAKMYVQNLSPDPIYDVRVHDIHAGFQAIQSNYGSRPQVHFDPYTFSSEVTYDIGRLMPNEMKECTVNMSTVLVSPNPKHFNYVIGKSTRVTYKREEGPDAPVSSLTYRLPAQKTIEGWWGTEEIPLNLPNIFSPVSNCNYIVVTHPWKLYSIYDAEEVDNLLSELAVFVHGKNAVLGYLDTPAPRTELLKVEGHKSKQGSVDEGSWSDLMCPSWKDNGYMLLVGETEIIPSFTIAVTVPAGQYTVPLTDQPYADVNDDGYTDLILGRIIGNDAAALTTPIMTSMGVEQNLSGYGFDASNALLISGMGNYESSFIKNINDISNVMDNQFISYFPNVKFHRTDYTDSSTAWNDLRPLFSDRDIIYFDGHGDANGWGHSVLSSAQVEDISFDGVNPGVIAVACHTGEYEEDNDQSIAEAFLAHGAGLYIGATRMTNTGINARNGLAYFRDRWRPWLGMGYAWRNLERSIWANWENWRFSLAYNIYGDPKFGYDAAKGLTLPVSGKGQAGDAPPEGITLDLPDYTVSSIEGVDYVEIPGGDTMSEPGQYQVPFWIEEIAIPPGYVVQGVDMLNRSKLQTCQGLHLPVSPDDFMENDAGEPFVPADYLWYPDIPFRWDIIPGSNNGDNGSTLVLRLYPFQYNTETTECQYYAHYEFSFSIMESLVAITTISVKKKAVLPGQPVNLFLELDNMQEADQTVRLRAVIEPYTGTLHMGGLPLHTLELPPGRSALIETWDTTGVPDGHYRLSIKLEDEDGNLLDTADDHFIIGADTADICYGDALADGDVDGSDLAIFIKDDLGRLDEFAATYGMRCE